MNSKKKSIIFFTEERGIAHVTRSVSIAEELQTRGYKVFFTLPKSKHSLIQHSKINPIPIADSVRDNDINSIEKLKDPDYIAQLVQEEQRLIDKYNPDCVVVDFRISAIVSCHSRSLPIYTITGSGGLPYGCYLPNFGFPEIIFRLVSPVIQKMIWNTKKKFLDSLSIVSNSIGSPLDFKELFRSIIYLVPEINGYLPSENKSLHINYLGPILWDGFEKQSPSWLKDIKPDNKTIYISFGGTGYDKHKLINLSISLVGKGYRVIVSSSTIAETREFPKIKNLFVRKYLSGLEVCKRVDLVICHGGYGTMIQAIIAGKPIIAIPFNPDQLLHALRFQELGLARSITSIDPLAITRLKMQDLMNIGKKISIQTLETAVEQIMPNLKQNQNKIQDFRSQILKTNGSKTAADVIEKNTFF